MDTGWDTMLITEWINPVLMQIDPPIADASPLGNGLCT